MGKIKILLITISILTITSCVQKSSKKTVVVHLTLEGIKNVKVVGIRGNEKPLSWDYDLELRPLKPDTLYEANFSLVTGYNFTEVKFTVNGNFELNEKSNRKIIFDNKDTTIYEARFNVEKK